MTVTHQMASKGAAKAMGTSGDWAILCLPGPHGKFLLLSRKEEFVL